MSRNRSKRKTKGSTGPREHLTRDVPDNPMDPAPDIRSSIREVTPDHSENERRRGEGRHVISAPTSTSPVHPLDSLAKELARAQQVESEPRRLTVSPVERRGATESPARKIFLSPRAGPSEPILAPQYNVAIKPSTSARAKRNDTQVSGEDSEAKRLADRHHHERL